MVIDMIEIGGVRCFYPTELIYESIKPLDERIYYNITVVQKEIAGSDESVKFDITQLPKKILSLKLGNMNIYTDKTTLWNDCTVGITHNKFGVNVMWFPNDKNDLGKLIKQK